MMGRAVTHATLPAVEWRDRVVAARRAPGVLPDPRLPRSPRVRDRWARMRPDPPLRREWDMEVWLAAPSVDAAEAAMRADVDPWERRCRARYGPGEMFTWVQQRPRRVIAEYRPHHTTRRTDHA